MVVRRYAHAKKLFTRVQNFTHFNRSSIKNPCKHSKRLWYFALETSLFRNSACQQSGYREYIAGVRGLRGSGLRPRPAEF